MRKLQESKSLMSSVSSKNTEMFLECAFVPLPGVADRSEFTSDYSLQLLLLSAYMPFWKNMFLLCVGLSDTCDLFL